MRFRDTFPVQKTRILPSLSRPPAVTKTVVFRIAPSPELSLLLRSFRDMCNEAIGIAVAAETTNRFELIEKAHPHLRKHGLHTRFILSACEVAYSLYKSKYRKSIPRIHKPFLKLDSRSYRLGHFFLRIPTTARRFIFLTLKGSDFHFPFEDDPELKRGSVTINENAVGIAFSKRVGVSDPEGVSALISMKGT
ncbi:MAG: hypothetical protein JRN06_01800 [Nitrososphaerota archaeon]|nr:hypothetical protein [Nitrososphaerota archaeon]MDG7023411.1 hypothetical protein [Nitrososphaerota archaeon]